MQLNKKKQLATILSVFYPYSKFLLSLEYVKEPVSFKIYCSIEVYSWRFSNYSEFYLGGEGCYAALMRPNKVETRLQLQKNGLVKVQKLVGRLAISWVKRVFMVWSCYLPAE